VRSAPISLFIFLFSMSLLEGLDSEETREKIRSNYWPILLVNWQVWPLLQVRLFPSERARVQEAVQEGDRERELTSPLPRRADPQLPLHPLEVRPCSSQSAARSSVRRSIDAQRSRMLLAQVPRPRRQHRRHRLDLLPQLEDGQDGVRWTDSCTLEAAGSEGRACTARRRPAPSSLSSSSSSLHSITSLPLCHIDLASPAALHRRL